MECNKEEAVRAKTIAEKKFEDKDFTGAKKFTLKSQTLYPGLDGISQMLITINVYIASENKINGESDWYGVLDVKPFDDDETIRKQYRKLVLMLHPDKNKSVGADGAFKIVSEAWKLLSDKSTRSAYNQRRKFQQVLHQSVRSSPSSSPFVNVVHKAASMPKCWNSANTTQIPSARVPPKVPARAQTKAQTKAKIQAQARAQAQAKAQYRAQTQAKAQAQAQDTFWTFCHGCQTHHEFYKVYLDQTLLCRNCHKPFRAVQMPKPAGIDDKTNKGGVDNKTDIRSLRPEVDFSMPFIGASKAANFDEKANMNRTSEEFNAQRLSKRRKD